MPSNKKSPSKWIVFATIFLAVILTLASYFNPVFGTELEHSTQWLGNVTPLAVLVVGYFLKEEIANWHYKKGQKPLLKLLANFGFALKN